MKPLASIRPCVLALGALAATACGSATESEVRTVAIAPDSLTLRANRSALLLATVLDASGAQVSGVPVTFTSRNPAVAATTPGGIVTAVAVGRATVVAAAGDAVDSIPVVVTAGGPLTVTLLTDSLLVPIGGTEPTVVRIVQDGLVIEDTYLAYASSDTSVCTVSATGVVAGLRSGFASVSVAAGAFRDSARVVVYAPFTGELQPRVPVAGGAWGLALSSTHVLYATQPLGSTVARFDLPAWNAGIPVTVSSGPLDVVFRADGQRAYVVSNSNVLSIVTVATGTVTNVPLSLSPWRVVLSADQTRLFVTTTVGTLLVLDATTGAQLSSVAATSGASNGAALSADGTKLYLSGFIGGELAEVTTATLAVRKNQPRFRLGGDGLQEVALAPDGAELYVACETGPITVASPTTLLPTDSIPASGAFGLLVTPDGRFLVATSARSPHIVVIDPKIRRVVRDFTVTGNPRRLAWDAATGSILVSNEAGYVDVIR